MYEDFMWTMKFFGLLLLGQMNSESILNGGGLDQVVLIYALEPSFVIGV